MVMMSDVTTLSLSIWNEGKLKSSISGGIVSHVE